jgi:hypothetical protein
MKIKHLGMFSCLNWDVNVYTVDSDQPTDPHSQRIRDWLNAHSKNSQGEGPLPNEHDRAHWLGLFAAASVSILIETGGVSPSRISECFRHEMGHFLCWIWQPLDWTNEGNANAVGGVLHQLGDINVLWSKLQAGQYATPLHDEGSAS